MQSLLDVEQLKLCNCYIMDLSVACIGLGVYVMLSLRFQSCLLAIGHTASCLTTSVVMQESSEIQVGHGE